jgi:hypothetical protein
VEVVPNFARKIGLTAKGRIQSTYRIDNMGSRLSSLGAVFDSERELNHGLHEAPVFAQ